MKAEPLIRVRLLPNERCVAVWYDSFSIVIPFVDNQSLFLKMEVLGIELDFVKLGPVLFKGAGGR